MDDPYVYQIKLFEMAKKENLVVVLPTGSGKTRVATLLINHYLELSPKSGNQKRIIAFLAKTKQLVKQQFQYIKKHLTDDEYNIKEFTGITYNTEGVHIDNWKEDDWSKIFKDTNVIAMTPAILYDAFRRSVLQVSQFSLIVIDECHHVRGNTPEMNVCIKLLSCSSENKPRILGLTASPKNSKKGTLEDAISELEKFMSSRVEILPDEEISKERPHKLPTCSLVVYNSTFEELKLDDDSLIKEWIVYKKGNSITLGRFITISHAFARVRYMEKLVSIYKHFLRVNTDPRVVSNEFNELPKYVRKNSGDSFKSNHKLTSNNYNYNYKLVRAVSKCLRSIGCIFNRCGTFLALLSIIIALDTKYLNECDSEKSTIDTTKHIESFQSIKNCVFSIDLLLKAEECLCYSLIEYIYIIYDTIPKSILNEVYQKIRDSPDHIIISTIIYMIMYNTCNSFIAGDSCIVKSIDISNIRFKNVSSSIVYVSQLLVNSSSNLLRRCVSGISYQSIEKIANEEELLISSSNNYISNSLVNDKVLKLCDILLDKRSNRHEALNQDGLIDSQVDSYNHVISIVFCDEKLTALSIHRYLDIYYKINANLSNSSVSITGSQNVTTQETCLQSFQLGMAPILISTTIVEEGIDVKGCELVINFDLPHTSKSYLQRRGRARADHSHYVSILTSNEEVETIINFYNETMEQHAYQRKSEYSPMDYIPDDSDSYITPSGAIATVNSAKEILVNYCDSLRKDNYSITQPIYDITTLTNVVKQRKYFYCSILLPNAISPHLRCVVGPTCGNKIEAEGRASLKCIKSLHLACEMSDRFYYKANINEDDMIINETFVESVDQSIRNDLSIKTTPDVLKTTNKHQRLLHFYRLDKRYIGSNEYEAIKSCKTCSYHVNAIDDIGLAFLNLLPSDINNLNMHWHEKGKVGYDASIRYVDSIEVTDEELYLMQRYHRAIGSWESECLIGPIDRWISIDEYTDIFKDSMSKLKYPNPIDHDKWVDSSNGSWYLLYPKPSLLEYYLSNKSVNCNWRNDWLNDLKQFANESQVLVHNLIVQNQIKYRYDLPEHANTKLSSEYNNYIISRGRERLAVVVDVNGNNNSIDIQTFSSKLFIPICYHSNQHFDVSTIDLNHDYLAVLGKSEYYYIGIMAPFVIFRLISSLLVHEAKAYLVDMSSSSTHSSLCNEINNIPNDTMMETFTCAQSNEKYNYNLIEFIGDTVLKFITSVRLFSLYPDRSEGFLTNQKIRYISNNHLTNVCRKFGLIKYLRILQCYDTTNGITIYPPGMLKKCSRHNLWNTHIVGKETYSPIINCNGLIHRKIRNSQERNQVQYYHTIPDIGSKVYADLIEAIIGSCFIHNGINAAEEILKIVDCYPIFNHNYSDITNNKSNSTSFTDTIHIPKEFPIYLINLATGVNLLNDTKENSPNSSTVDLKTLNLHGCNDYLEIALGYRFNDLTLLEEALTHSSCSNSKNNQRLEFLGDAVLDFAVVSFINLRDYCNEGQLHLFKQSKTTNERLYQLTCELKLYEYMKCSNEMMNDIKQMKDYNKEELVKPLADLFEAIIGAIYLDSKRSIETIKQIIRFVHLID